MAGGISRPSPIVSGFPEQNNAGNEEGSKVLNGAGAVEEGNGILGHILGGKDASRSLSRQVAGSTGISDTMIRQMLPVLASLAMGAMSKKIGSTSSADLTGSAQGIVDDIMGLVGSFLKR